MEDFERPAEEWVINFSGIVEVMKALDWVFEAHSAYFHIWFLGQSISNTLET